MNDFLKSPFQKSRKPVHRSLKEEGLTDKTCGELNIHLFLTVAKQNTRISSSIQFYVGFRLSYDFINRKK